VILNIFLKANHNMYSCTPDKIVNEIERKAGIEIMLRLSEQSLDLVSHFERCKQKLYIHFSL
jgi:hypothetical protein